MPGKLGKGYKKGKKMNDMMMEGTTISMKKAKKAKKKSKKG